MTPPPLFEHVTIYLVLSGTIWAKTDENNFLLISSLYLPVYTYRLNIKYRPPVSGKDLGKGSKTPVTENVRDGGVPPFSDIPFPLTFWPVAFRDGGGRVPPFSV